VSANEENASPKDGKALHGAPSEVSWDGGKGRQPYSNQGTREADAPGEPEKPAGDRGEQSGHNLDQLDAVRRKP
jgi:hypothetical protein